MPRGPFAFWGQETHLAARLYRNEPRTGQLFLSETSGPILQERAGWVRLPYQSPWQRFLS